MPTIARVLVVMGPIAGLSVDPAAAQAPMQPDRGRHPLRHCR
jgi:hypothetical protein